MLTVLRTTALAAMLCMVGLLAACSDDSSPTDPTPSEDDGSITFTVNGGGLSNKIFSFADSSSFSVYSSVNDFTVIRFNGKVDGKATSIIVTFKGTSKNTRQLDGTTSEGVTTQWGTNDYIAMTQGSIVLTKYDGVGGDVAGTFSGTGVGTVNGQIATFTISAGSFTSKRAS